MKHNILIAKTLKDITTSINNMTPIISKNELKEILKDVLPNDVLHIIASYHQHPIIEYIGKDKLIETFQTLSIVPTMVFNQPYWTIKRPSKKYSETNYCEYLRERKWNVNWVSRNCLSAHYSIRNVFYPIDTRDYKCDIMRHALKCEVKLKKSWTKSKMIAEYYKQQD